VKAPGAGDRRDDPSRRPFRLPAGRRQAAVDVREELRFHLEMCAADLERTGLTPERARAEALRRFGDPEAVAEECRTVEGDRQARVRRGEWLAALRQDVAHAVRLLRRAPGFAVAAVLTLALGLGATTAMFSVVDAVLLRPLPIEQPERVVVLVPGVGGEDRGGSPALLAAWGERARRVAGVAATRDRDATLLLHGTAERLAGAAVSGTFAGVLGIRPALGRAIRPADDRPGAPPVVVLGHRLWARAFGASPRALGTAVTLDGVAHTVVGVLPAALDPVLPGAAFQVPLALDPSQRENFTPYLTLLARLAPGARAEDAARELDAVTAALGPRALVDGARQTVRVAPAGRELTDAYRRPLLLMLAAVGAVLLIGCANVATLVLARGVGRARELAVRASLGAGRGRLARQLAAEHLVLGALATALALPVAFLGVRALAAGVPAEVPRLATAGLDGRAVAVAAALGLLVSVLCGLAPALHQRHLDVRGVLQASGRGATDRGGDRWRRRLVGGEVALALALLVGAGLLARSAAALGRVRPGFDTAHVLTARLALPERDYPELPAAVRAFERVLDAARREPGVSGAALVSRVPLGGSPASVDLAAAGRPFDRASRVSAALRLASPGYFRAMGIPLLAGRDLGPADGAGAPPVVVVNAALARRLAAGAPLGTVVGGRVRSDNGAFADPAGRPRELEVVGVAGDVLDGGLRGAPAPEFYAPLGQVSEEPWNYWIGRELVLVARTPGDPAAAAPALRRAVASVDARVPLHDVRSTSERLAGALAVERFSRRLLALLGALGLGLSALGIHGVVAYAAGQRAREVGVRLALGATPARAARLVVRQGLRPVLAGLAVGAVVALAGARAAAGLLFGVSPFDPVALAGAAGLLAAVAAAACYGPARRVARVDPASSLRAE
jgi:predicted permease